MAIQYRLYQNKNLRNTVAYGRWYAKAVTLSEIHTDDLAYIVQRNCSMKKSDVKAVIEELVEVIRDQLAQSNRVVLDGLGAFRPSIVSSGAVAAADYSATANVKSLKVLFQPAVKLDASGKRVKTLLDGTRVSALPYNDVDTTKQEAAGTEGTGA